MDSFYALAEPKRRKIMELIAVNGRLSATEISSKFDITAQAISQHLNMLLSAKLLIVHRHAQRRIYEINPNEMMEVEEWTKKTLKMWNERFDRLDKVLKWEKKKLRKTNC